MQNFWNIFKSRMKIILIEYITDGFFLLSNNEGYPFSPFQHKLWRLLWWQHSTRRFSVFVEKFMQKFI